MNFIPGLTVPLLICLTLSGCGGPQPADPLMETIQAQDQNVENARKRQMEELQALQAQKTLENLDVPAEGTFVVEFDLDAGTFEIEVHREWAPIGADRFYRMVKDKYFDGAGFFRVVPGFMVQFGLAADPAMTRKWSGNLQDDPVKQSNTKGYVTFAKTGAPNSRSSQIFINYGNNQRLDPQGFAPFGKVISGMDVVEEISSAHGEQPDQNALRARGNAYLKEVFPRLDYISTARIVKDDLASDSGE